MASKLYNSGIKKIGDGTIDWDTNTIKVALVTASYTPDIDVHDFFDDLTNEVSGTGYTAGGATLANCAVTQDNTNDGAYFDADDTSWTTSTITNARYAIVYKSTGTAATSPLIAVVDLGANYSSVNATFQITWNAAGVFYIRNA